MAARRNVIRAVRAFVALAMLSTFAPGVVSLKAQTKLEVRLAEEQPGSGLVEAPVFHSDKKVYLHESAVVTNDDVRDARVTAASGTAFNVGVSFTPQGAEKMASATQAHIGKPLAILVNGTVVAAPTLRGVIRQSALITGDWTREQADEVAAGLTGK